MLPAKLATVGEHHHPQGVKKRLQFKLENNFLHRGPNVSPPCTKLKVADECLLVRVTLVRRGGGIKRHTLSTLFAPHKDNS